MSRFSDIKNKLCVLCISKVNSYNETERLCVHYDATYKPIYSMHELRRMLQAHVDAWYPGWTIEQALLNGEILIGDDI